MASLSTDSVGKVAVQFRDDSLPGSVRDGTGLGLSGGRALPEFTLVCPADSHMASFSNPIFAQARILC